MASVDLSAFPVVSASIPAVAAAAVSAVDGRHAVLSVDPAAGVRLSAAGDRFTATRVFTADGAALQGACQEFVSRPVPVRDAQTDATWTCAPNPDGKTFNCTVYGNVVGATGSARCTATVPLR